MSKKYESTFIDASFDTFLKTGFIIQKPYSKCLWVGIGHSLKHSNYVYLSDFYHSNFKSWSPELLIKTDVEQFARWISSHKPTKLKLQFNTHFDENYEKDVRKSIEWIKKSPNLLKLVCVTRATYIRSDVGTRPQRAHPVSQISKLRLLNGSLYGHWNEDSGVIGVSPEPLFNKVSDNKFQTIALAGTISTSVAQYEQSIFADPKERKEHQFVIEDISHKLKTISNKVSIGETTCFNFGPFAHLKTDIHFNVDNFKVEEVITAMGPTAALGGYPSKMTFQYLKQLGYYNFEKDQRIFGGVMGVDIGDDVFSLVMIRNLSWYGDEFIIDSGSGIVEGSNPVKERAEVNSKRQSIEDIYCE